MITEIKNSQLLVLIFFIKIKNIEFKYKIEDYDRNQVNILSLREKQNLNFEREKLMAKIFFLFCTVEKQKSREYPLPAFDSIIRYKL